MLLNRSMSGERSMPNKLEKSLQIRLKFDACDYLHRAFEFDFAYLHGIHKS